MTQHRQKVLELNWYLFRVRTNKERNVCARIEQAGYTAAMPEVTRRVRQSRHSKARVDRSYPGLKSYVLIGFDPRYPAPFRKIIDMPFVVGVVGFDSFASRLKSDQVFDFLNNGAWDKRSIEALIQEWEPDYVDGDTVKLRGAGFDGVAGRVVHMDRRLKRARVAVPFLGSEREMEVPLDAAYKYEAVA